MKKIGFLSFGHWGPYQGSQTRTAADSLLQAIDLAQGAEQLGIDGAYVRVHHFARQQASPFPLLGAMGARTSKIELGTGVIDMRYENPLYMAESAAQADLISASRLQLGVGRGSPEDADRGYRYFGHELKGRNEFEMAREHTLKFLEAIDGTPIAERDPRTPGFGKLPITPQSPGLRQRIWWGAGSAKTALWAAEHGLNLMSSTLMLEEKGIPFHQLQYQQIEAYRSAWQQAGWGWTPQVSVSRSILPIIDEQTRAYFLAQDEGESIGILDGIRSRFSAPIVGQPEEIARQLVQDSAVAAADNVMVTIPNQLGVDFNLKLLEAIAQIARTLGWHKG